MGLIAIKPVMAICVACTVWGLSGIYYYQLSHISALEVLAHRSLWALVFFSGFLLYKGQLVRLIKSFMSIRELALHSASTLLICVNWFSFIFALQSGQAVQASFGYYIFPLVAVLFGFLFKGERFSKIQSLAILCAGISVVSLGFAMRLMPSIALIIAITFGAYGLIKGLTKLGSIESVTIETMLIAPFSLSFIIYSFFQDYYRSVDVTGSFEFLNYDLLLLMLSGLITGGPLILFSFATKKLSYATVGILQYINPTLQFLVAIFILVEPVNSWHSLALGFIWVGIVVYSGESWRLESRR